jgi:hypothetical protein
MSRDSAEMNGKNESPGMSDESKNENAPKESD